MPDPRSHERAQDEPGQEAADAARVRETLGAGLRKFYDSVLEEPIPAEWLKLVGDGAEEGPE